MLSRFVVMVDAGYLFANAASCLSERKSKTRGDVACRSPAALAIHFVEAARTALGLPRDRELLRVYWYDGVMPSGHTEEQQSIMRVSDLLFRGGTVNARGQQKGVDSLIVTDLIELAGNQAISDALLVTGDSDLAVGMDLAQRKGVRIAVLGVPASPDGTQVNQSREITSRADRVAAMSTDEVRKLFIYSPAEPNKPGAATATPSQPTQVQHQIRQPAYASVTEAVDGLLAAFPELRATALGPNGAIPREVDTKLMAFVLKGMAHGRLSDDERATMREAFRTRVAGP